MNLPLYLAFKLVNTIYVLVGFTLIRNKGQFFSGQGRYATQGSRAECGRIIFANSGS